MAFLPFGRVKVGDTENTFTVPCVERIGSFVKDPWDRNAQAASYNMVGQVIVESKDGASDCKFFDEFAGQLIVTDARVVVLANAAEPDGSATVGHVRYEWLRMVGYREKSWSNHNCIVLVYEDQNSARYLVQIVLKSKADVAALANDILRRACLYRLTMTDEKPDKEVAFYTQYSTGRKITPKFEPKKQISSVEFSRAYLAPGGQKFRPEWGAPKKEESNA